MYLEIAFKDNDPDAMNAYALLKDMGRLRSKFLVALLNSIQKQYPDIGQDKKKIEFLKTGLECGLISITPLQSSMSPPPMPPSTEPAYDTEEPQKYGISEEEMALFKKLESYGY